MEIERIVSMRNVPALGRLPSFLASLRRRCVLFRVTISRKTTFISHFLLPLDPSFFHTFYISWASAERHALRIAFKFITSRFSNFNGLSTVGGTHFIKKYENVCITNDNKIMHFIRVDSWEFFVICILTVFIQSDE